MINPNDPRLYAPHLYFDIMTSCSKKPEVVAMKKKKEEEEQKKRDGEQLRSVYVGPFIAFLTFC